MKFKLFIIFVIFLLVSQILSKNFRETENKKIHVGGYSENKESTKEALDVLKSVESQLKAKGVSGNFVILSYSTQVVAGMNYLIRFTAGGKNYKVTVFKPLPYLNKPNELSSFKTV
jgi:hypothetical protein